MKLLLDTNIFLEVLLSQDRSEEARSLLLKYDNHDLYISDFSLHSIGLLVFRQKQHAVYRQFLNDMIFTTGIKISSISAEDMESVIDAAQKFSLDFDDAYQYAVALKYNLTIVSFDKDFDRTEKGKKIPSDIK
jgi:hypothetical protein